MHTFGSNMRESIMRVLVSKASSSEDREKKECKEKHVIKTIQVGTLQPRNLRSLFLKTELAQLFEKRRSFRKIFGNESLLLNQLQAQCPICGSLISLGHFSIIQKNVKNDKLNEHVRLVHFADPFR